MLLYPRIIFYRLGDSEPLQFSLDLVSKIGSMGMLASGLIGQDMKKEIFNKKAGIFFPSMFENQKLK